MDRWLGIEILRGARACLRVASAAALVTALAPADALGQENTRVSVASNGDEADDWSLGGTASISADGRLVAFTSSASNLVASDTNGTLDVFVHDRVSGTTERVSVDSSGNEADAMSSGASLSADGRFVAFESSASNLVAGDGNGRVDVFVHDRSTGATERVSVDSAGVEANLDCFDAVISADGNCVAFDSLASNLVAGDTAGVDIFVHDRTTGATERVSVDSLGAQSNGDCWLPSISGDGSVVAFISTASNLVANDGNGFLDGFVHDRASGTTERVSVDSAGGESNGRTFRVVLSEDGNVAGFDCDATNLGGSENSNPLNVAVFVHDRTLGTTERVSVDGTGAPTPAESAVATVSADGRSVAFMSGGLLVSDDSGDFFDVFVRDRLCGITTRVSVDSTGAEANGASYSAAMTSDARVVTFTSDATNLVAGDGNGVSDVFVHVRAWVDATWSNYDSGFPGTNGIPSLTARAAPLLGTSLTLDLENSYGVATAALLFVGFERTAIMSGWGGQLLVVPAITTVVALPPVVLTMSGELPSDVTLLGATVDLQAFESDPGAAKGVSFTPGLELVLGY